MIKLLFSFLGWEKVVFQTALNLFQSADKEHIPYLFPEYAFPTIDE